MGTLIHNGLLCTNNNDNHILLDGAVYFNDGIIVETGKSGDLLTKYSTHSKIDAEGKLIMPGWINAHMHCYSTYARGLVIQKLPGKFSEILENLWWKLDKALDSESIYFSTLIPAISAIKNGVTAFIDHHSSPNCIDGSLDRIEDALSQIGMRASLCYEVSDRNGKEKTQQGIKENIRFIKKCNKPDNLNGLYSAMFGLHASFTLNDETLLQVRAQNKDLDSGFHIHLAEGPDDNNLEIKAMRAAHRLDRFGILGNKTIAAHGNHLNDEELDLVSGSGTMIIHNPQSNMNNAVGRADIFKMMDKNILVGIGSDGMNATLYPEIRTANLIHKHDSGNPNTGWNEIQKIALKNNPEIFQRISGQKIGRIEPGFLADLILVDYYPPTEVTPQNLWGHILFGIADARVDTTIINGRIVMQNCDLPGISEREVAEKSREFAEKVWRRI